MSSEQQKNMYEVRAFRDKVDQIIKPAFNTWQSVKIVKEKLAQLLSKENEVVVDTLDDDEFEPHAFI